MYIRLVFSFLISCVFIISSLSYSSNIDLSDFYEVCQCKNDGFTQRIVDEDSRYCMKGNQDWYECLF